jgi:hypothetical protein
MADSGDGPYGSDLGRSLGHVIAKINRGPYSGDERQINGHGLYKKPTSEELPEGLFKSADFLKGMVVEYFRTVPDHPIHYNLDHMVRVAVMGPAMYGKSIERVDDQAVEEMLTVMLAGLVHDVGDRRVNHAEDSFRLARPWIYGLNVPKNVQDDSLDLVRNHERVKDSWRDALRIKLIGANRLDRMRNGLLVADVSDKFYGPRATVKAYIDLVLNPEGSEYTGIEEMADELYFEQRPDVLEGFDPVVRDIVRRFNEADKRGEASLKALFEENVMIIARQIRDYQRRERIMRSIYDDITGNI